MKPAAWIGLAFLVLVVFTAASAGSSTPVPPNLASYPVQVALAATLNTSNAYAYSVQETNNSTTTTSTSSPYLILHSTWSNLTIPYTNGTIVQNETWINTTRSCGSAACPAVSVDCDGVIFSFSSPTSYRIDRPCRLLAFLWDGTEILESGGTAPTYSITRIQTFAVTQPSVWYYEGVRTILADNVSIPKPSSFGDPATYTPLSAAWAIPYPAGTWDPAATQITFVNESTSVVYFDQLTNYIVLQWAYPSYGVLQYTVSLLGTPGQGHQVGNGTATVPSALRLSLGNITTTGQGGYTGSVSWYNGAATAFNGSVELIGTWTSTATNVTVYANGQPIQSFDAGSYVLISAGEVTVPPGSSVNFVVDYVATPSYTLNTPLFTINGNAYTVPVLMFLATAVGAIILSWAHVSNRYRNYTNLVIGLLAFGTLWGVWLGL